MSDKVILLAVSGGIDSMVMLHRMNEAYGKKGLAVAHCNFQLRAAESDEDELFVKEHCRQIGVPLHIQRFQTEDHAKAKGIGIQEAARMLRYDWFFELINDHGYSSLATAHHKDDSIETFFINILRGTGPKGLSGIQEDSDRNVIRPIMDMDQEDILNYARDHRLKWREDSSNTSEHYLRNVIRHKLIPTMEDFRPGFKKVMHRNMAQQKSLAFLLDRATEDYRSQYFKVDGDITRIGIQGQDSDCLILSQALKPYGFNADQIENILSSRQSGKQIHSHTHVISSNRGGLLLSPLSKVPEGPWQISEHLETSELPFQLEVHPLKERPKSLDPDNHLAYLDQSQLDFPLTVRLWKDGDRFRPLGMKGYKLVSDFLTDEKIPLHEKERTYIMLRGNEIAWVIGKRISDVFKCKEGEPCLLWRYLP